MFVHEINNHSLTEGGYFLYERTLMKERSQIRLDYLISVRLKPDESGSADAWTGAIHIEKRSILLHLLTKRILYIEIIVVPLQ